MIGQSISHYSIVEKLGEGGMGIVYKAHDTKLDRFVALKFLPPHMAASEQDKARFIQEAKSAAALNHPNVCSILDILEHDKQLFIVMEFVDGQTLQERMGSLSLKQSVEIAIQVAEGLAAAHEKGIVHRDIKPENIMVRKDGIAQIMDFGLAKLHSATRLTKAGSTVGTVGYMSPEQVQGLDVDHRSDIFSLGVLLYEMIAGASPFKGVHETAIIYEIVNVDPQPIGMSKPEVDPELDAIVLECLAKDPVDRYQSVAEVARNLRRVKRESSRSRVSRMTAARPAFAAGVGPQERSEHLSRNPIIVWSAVGISVLLTALSLWLIFFRGTEQPQEVRLNVLPPAGSAFGTLYGGHVALSPDGSMIAFVAIDSNRNPSLYLRMLNDITPRKLPGTEGAQRPFWSPDNKWIGFETGTKLKKIDIMGGSPLTICDIQGFQGASWSTSGQIVFNGIEASAGLWVVSANGGKPKPLMNADTITLANQIGSSRWPWFLPDGDHFLYSVGSPGDGLSQGRIMVGSLSSQTSKKLLDVSSNAVYADGYIFYCRDNKILAHPFDVRSLEFTGDPYPVTEGPSYDRMRFKADFSVSSNGTIVQSSSKSTSSVISTAISWFDRTGKPLPGPLLQGDIVEVSLSPDRKRLAVTEGTEGAYDIWTYDLQRNVRSRLTFDPAVERLPAWTPDGTTIYYSMMFEGALRIFRKNANGLGAAELVYRADTRTRSTQVSRDGRYLLFLLLQKSASDDIFVLPLSGERVPVPVIHDPFDKEFASLSPDGRWLAYCSNESGPYQLYIIPVPQTGARWQITSGPEGAGAVHWRGDGKELFFVSGGNMNAVPIDVKGQVLMPGTPRPLFPEPFIPGQMSWDVTADGTTFVGVRSGSLARPNDPLLVVMNWKRP